MTLSLPKPVSNADSQVYWQGARDRKLLIRRCNSCGQMHFMPRFICPDCWSEDLEWVESRGAGSVYSFSVIHRAPTPVFAGQTPYVTAMIELDEGPRIVANILGQDALSVKIGDRVLVTFEDRGDGDLIPQFERVAN
ncbi:Zn-ribbon domain-containing OB-fold protein [Advenella mimigardefordensis]|uniref:Zn-ribbon domain-containing OB-fold protein n=1 Tax=Advenella mimigardefordensis (strain DSM 17166 / LMG 22922 / DPN7) TaxID=1247726 RepID=W0PGA2_ADVMD|nr:Zn-ribbon domain-containing OB-fold protein [Advenella mimigardefordensis]AHG64138.1 hypothetical protein MIM_c20590 [Advenella mimigardefordensis DPN7]